ncbi:sensor histidine kinase [Thiolapillus sp.]
MSASAKQLEDAFEAFNQVGAELSRSYSALQTQVAQLSAELQRARDEKISELMEKERLADQLDRLLQALPAGVLVVDRGGRVVDVNRQAREMLGDDLPGKNWDEIAHAAFVPGGDELRLRDGRWISLSMSQPDKQDGRILLLTDISETRRLQNLLNQHQRLTALGEMSARLAHQIRTPLSTLLLYLPQMEKTGLEAERRQELGARMRECLRHMEQTTVNMLAYARRDDEMNQSFLLGEVIDNMLRTMENQLRSKQAKLQISRPEQDIRLRGNRDAFLGALINLVSNALEACGDSSAELQLRVFEDENSKTVIELQDNGSGMSDEVMERIFEPFFTTRSSGTGLGLAVVKAVIQSLNGSIQLHSVPDRGTCVRICLPNPEKQAALPATMLPRESHAPIPRQAAADGCVGGIMENNL